MEIPRGERVGKLTHIFFLMICGFDCECVELMGDHVAAYLSWWVVSKKLK